MTCNLGKITLKIFKKRKRGRGEEKQKAVLVLQSSVSTVCHKSSARIFSSWLKSLCMMKENGRVNGILKRFLFLDFTVGMAVKGYLEHTSITHEFPWKY